MRRPIFTACLAVVMLVVLACGCAGSGKGPTDEELITGMLTGWKAALETKDLEKMMAPYSEDFAGEGGAGKPELRQFIQRAIDEGYLDDAKVDLEKAQTTREGETATVGPVALSGSYGTLELDLKLKKEADGAWRIVGSDRR
jgi:ketosteroid isomerase-like protein